ncbi:MAG: copper chaperone PCu(A)C [Pseudomonadota bacterium]
MFARLVAAAGAALVALPALAADITVEDAYARSANPKVAGAFMTLRNNADAPAKLVAARSDIARKTELHTHEMEDGIARMRQVESMTVPAGGLHRLQRGGDHVMFMGLHEPLEPGDRFPLTLVFEDGTEVTVEVEVDNARRPAHGGGAGQGEGKAHGMSTDD